MDLVEHKPCGSCRSCGGQPWLDDIRAVGRKDELRGRKNDTRDQRDNQLSAVFASQHVVDTVLLLSAITLAIWIQQDPVHDSWLSAKVVGLLAYIGLGMVALRFGKTLKTRIVACIAAQAAFFYIVMVALTKNPALLF